MKDFVLKDDLGHPAYAWPETMLAYRFYGPCPKEGRDVLLMDGRPVCWQAEPCEKGGYTLKITADLPTGGVRTFSWGRGETPPSPLSAGLDNGVLRLESGDGLFCVAHKNGARIRYALKTEGKILSHEKKIRGGGVEKELCGVVTLEGGARYAYTVKLKKDLDYIEFYEEMNGFGNTPAALAVSWERFDPYFRHTADRGKEKIDAYLFDGAFPFTLDPYAPRVSAWNQRYVSYVDKTEKFWVGFLLHDLENYDDGRYAVWASDRALALKPGVYSVTAPVRDGKRALMTVLCDSRPPEALGNHYLRYHSLVSLNKVKDYVLKWSGDRNAHPKCFKSGSEPCGYWYFRRAGAPDPADMTDILDRYASVFRELEQTEPVSCRAFIYAWAPIFDMTASRMTAADFDRVRAAMAFVCYTLASEDYCPVDNMLAGHPNFLTDVVGAVGIFAALLDGHPMRKKWLARFETALARNFKYHARPAVEAWDALGGRWTENTGCYLFAMLHAAVFVSSVVRETTGETPLLYPHFVPLLRFLVNTQCAENERGRRLYPPQGAHAGTGEFGGNFGHGFSITMLMLGEMCRYYEPLLSEYILRNFRNDFEGVLAAAPAYERGVFARLENRGGTPPALYSCKYTGYGFVLRHAVNTDDETTLILQQLDEGPNYRWGRAAQGGCGELYYYADRTSYTGHAAEDVGDENRGDVQSCTNFGVLIGHEFRSVGRNELTEPLMDFGFVRYARVNAGAYSAPYYRYRSVTAVENAYFAVHDAVGDQKQYGRFTWAQREGGAFPEIWNVRPAVSPSLIDGGSPLDMPSSVYRIPEKRKTLVKAFDGCGDFLTVVSHLRVHGSEPLIRPPAGRAYGFDIELAARRDCVFSDSARIRLSDGGCSFDGYAGYCSQAADEVRLALFDGTRIELSGCALTVPYDPGVRHGMSLRFLGGEGSGSAVFQESGEVRVKLPAVSGARVYVDGRAAEFSRRAGEYVFEMPAGRHEWLISQKRPRPQKLSIDFAQTEKGGFTARWSDGGESEYIVEWSRDAVNWREAGRTKENAFAFRRLEDGKYFVRVCGVNADGAPGAFSHPYPAYVNADKPHCPEGLRVTAAGGFTTTWGGVRPEGLRENAAGGFTATWDGIHGAEGLRETAAGGFTAAWGGVLGAGTYRLYRIEDGGFSLAYEGRERACAVESGTYCVTAVNGNGESEKSLPRSTSDLTACWDNRPDKRFVRDTRSNEHGYPGFDYVTNPRKQPLDYPD